MTRDIVRHILADCSAWLTLLLGVAGDAHRVCMILNQYETSSGGPFFRLVQYLRRNMLAY